MTAEPAGELALPDLPPASERQGDPGHDQAAERASAIRLLTLRARGMTYSQIAEDAGYADASGARTALLRALDRHEAENAAQLRSLENLRLDDSERVLRGIAGSAVAKPVDRIRAVDALTRLAARRARLNGLDAPVQVALSASIQAELSDALGELGEQLGIGSTVPGEVLDRHDDLGEDGPRAPETVPDPQDPGTP